MTEIKESLIETNPWWDKPFKPPYFERELYQEVKKYLVMRQIIAFTGLRRVGKTTLMQKIAADAIAEGFDPKHILYFSFDEFPNLEIRTVLNTYSTLWGMNLREGSYLLLLDEIQKVSDWENQVKTLYDFSRNLKFVISGSESLFVRRRSKESLAGRIFEFVLTPLTFREFMRIHGITDGRMLPSQELRLHWIAYTKTLGFPELIDTSDRNRIKKYLQEGIVEKILYRDIPFLYKASDTTALATILRIIMNDPGQLIHISKLAKELGISRNTLSAYLRYLEDAFLIRKLYNFSHNRRKIERKLKKYYPTIVSPDLLFRQDDHAQSKVFEWSVVMQLNAEFFWRDPQKHEIDAVLVNDAPPLPVEIKYGKIDDATLRFFLKKFKVPKGYIITAEAEERRTTPQGEILIVPAQKFFLTYTPHGPHQP